MVIVENFTHIIINDNSKNKIFIYMYHHQHGIKRNVLLLPDFRKRLHTNKKNRTHWGNQNTHGAKTKYLFLVSRTVFGQDCGGTHTCYTEDKPRTNDGLVGEAIRFMFLIFPFGLDCCNGRPGAGAITAITCRSCFFFVNVYSFWFW